MVVIEDDEDARVLLGRYLEKLGYPAHFFATAEEALDQLAGDIPSLILLDRQLPGLDGIEFCRQFRTGSGTRDCYIIMITGSDAPATIESALQAGANDYLVKPVTFEALRTRIIIARQKIKEFRSQKPEPEGPLNDTLQHDLQQALERGQLEIYYQPIYGLRIGPFAEGLEALLRWKHPEHGMISPARFIPLAERNGIIHSITDFVLRSAIDQTKRWQANRPDLYVSVNVSARNLMDDSLIETVNGFLKESDLAADRLQLEITETNAMQNPEQAGRLMQTIHDQGVRVAIDDFGTGYSSLAYLQDFNIHTLKIDRSFTRQIPANRHTMAITEAVLSLASRLNVKTVVEGVETPEQFQALKELGFRRFQGYYFARPMPADEVPAAISRQIP